MGSQCYLPPDTSEHGPPYPSHAGWYSIYLPGRDGRLSWPCWLDSAPAGSRTSDLLITSPTPNRCTTKYAVRRTQYDRLSQQQLSSLSTSVCEFWKVCLQVWFRRWRLRQSTWVTSRRRRRWCILSTVPRQRLLRLHRKQNHLRYTKISPATSGGKSKW